MKQFVLTAMAVYTAAITTVNVFFLNDVKQSYVRLESRLDTHIQNTLVKK